MSFVLARLRTLGPLGYFYPVSSLEHHRFHGRHRIFVLSASLQCCLVAFMSSSIVQGYERTETGSSRGLEHSSLVGKPYLSSFAAETVPGILQMVVPTKRQQIPRFASPWGNEGKMLKG